MIGTADVSTNRRKRALTLETDSNRSFVREVNDEVFQGIAGIIKASGLPVEAVNEIFAQLRRLGENMMRDQ
jgi:hypothetical protein